MSPNQPVRPRFHGRAWRFAVILAAASILLLFQASNAFAAGIEPAPSIQKGGGVVEATVLDVLCVTGEVINHQEQPQEGWTVTATYVGDEGSYAPMSAVSNDKGRFRFDLPATGRWSFAINNPDGWSPITPLTFEVNVTYGSTNCLNIRFKLEQLITVYVHKIDDQHQPLVGWIITATPGPDNLFAEPVTAVTDENGIATFNLPPGQWTFTEAPPPNAVPTWWRPIAPISGVQVVDVASPGPITIRFKNIVAPGPGCIGVNKSDLQPSGASVGLPGWQVQVLRMDGTIADRGQTNAFGDIVFTNLPLGPYIVQEEMQPGWEPVTPTMYQVVLTRDATSCQQINFVNRQLPNGFCIVGRKVDDRDGVGIAGWKISAAPVAEGGFVPDPVVTDGAGYFRIDLPKDDYRIPGSRYVVTEAGSDGWTPIGPTEYSVTLPWQEGPCVVIHDFVNVQTQRDVPPDKPKDHGKPDHGKPGWHGACSAQHWVVRGDTLSRIARHYHTTVNDLMWANPQIRNPNRIYVGQAICIP